MSTYSCSVKTESQCIKQRKSALSPFESELTTQGLVFHFWEMKFVMSPLPKILDKS